MRNCPTLRMSRKPKRMKPRTKKNTDGFDLNHLIVEFTGEFSPANFLHYLSRFPMPQGRVHIHMEVTAE